MISWKCYVCGQSIFPAVVELSTNKFNSGNELVLVSMAIEADRVFIVHPECSDACEYVYAINVVATGKIKLP